MECAQKTLLLENNKDCNKNKIHGGENLGTMSFGWLTSTPKMASRLSTLHNSTNYISIVVDGLGNVGLSAKIVFGWPTY
jgi:hypothetical protein